MKMKNILYIMLALVLSTGAAFTQDGGDKASRRAQKKAKIKEMKIAFLTQEMGLTEGEAQNFWPVYNAHGEKMKAIRKEHRELRNKFKGKKIDDLSDAEANELIDGEAAFRQKKFDAENQFNSDLKSVLPVKKVLKFHKAERKFKRKLLKKMRKRGKGKRGRGPHGPHGPRGPHGPEGGDDMPPPMHD